MSEVTEMLGKTITEVTGQVGGEEINFKFDDGIVARLYHSQDCCESVEIESIVGDLQDLVGNPLLVAEEVVSNEKVEGVEVYQDDSFTWTFYKFATIKGHVDVRWFGSSNGYYSESVNFYISAHA